MTAAVEPARPRTDWRSVLRALREPRVLLTLLLGFSSGLPFMLAGNTLGFWLREGGMDLASIGFFTWVGLTYTLKFLWAPIMDKADPPVLSRWLGRRRGWMALSQIVVAIGLLGMAATGPGGGLLALAGFALLTAFASATQDVVVDAWRIEQAESSDEQGLLSAAYQLGYRIALLCTDALILILAAHIGWVASYTAAAAAMAVGLGATLVAKDRIGSVLPAGPVPLWTARGLYDAIVGPFLAFFQQHGQFGLLILLVVSLYRLPDFLMGPMANPLYVDLGLTKEIVGSVRATVGLWGTIVGISVGGLCAIKLGLVRTLVLGAVAGPASNIAFSVMALVGPDPIIFAAAMFIDNASIGICGTALTAYMASLTSLGYTATQYALLSSFYALLGKLLKGFAGVAMEALQVAGFGLLDSYALFFAGTALIGIPTVILSIFLARAVQLRRPAL